MLGMGIEWDVDGARVVESPLIDVDSQQSLVTASSLDSA